MFRPVGAAKIHALTRAATRLPRHENAGVRAARIIAFAVDVEIIGRKFPGELLQHVVRNFILGINHHGGDVVAAEKAERVEATMASFWAARSKATQQDAEFDAMCDETSNI